MTVGVRRRTICFVGVPECWSPPPDRTIDGSRGSSPQGALILSRNARPQRPPIVDPAPWHRLPGLTERMVNTPTNEPKHPSRNQNVSDADHARQDACARRFRETFGGIQSSRSCADVLETIARRCRWRRYGPADHPASARTKAATYSSSCAAGCHRLPSASGGSPFRRPAAAIFGETARSTARTLGRHRLATDTLIASVPAIRTRTSCAARAPAPRSCAG